MCGIVGYVGKRPALNVLLEGLRSLEYRGYDSSGVGLLIDQKIHIVKAEGRLLNVEKLFSESQFPFEKSQCGIGHTRWATHGKPTAQNAHPHQVGHVVLVHNGIIENYLDLKRRILEGGGQPISETDSELLGFLIYNEMEKGQSLQDAVIRSFAKVEGQCSVVVMSTREPGVIMGINNGPPLVVCRDPEGGTLLASDVQPLLRLSSEVYYLRQGQFVVCRAESLSFFHLTSGKDVKVQPTHIQWSAEKMSKGSYPHYMLKEIYEQPIALTDTLNGVLDRSVEEPFALVPQPALEILRSAQEFFIVACGTSWHAALLGKYWIEQRARISVSVEIASEFRYRDPVLRPGVVVIGISQSGETADTLAVVREMKKRQIPTLGICNVRNSSLSREVDAMLYTSAGPEIGVASTKTFTTQLLILYSLAGHLSYQRKTKKEEEVKCAFQDLIKIPHLLADELEVHSEMVTQVQKTARALGEAKGFFFMGRGYSYPIALEGALKLKELAYDYAEGYAAGELKHGPIAMIDQGMVVFVLAPRDPWRDKTVSNLEEVKARGAIIVGVGDCNDEDLQTLCDHWIPLPPSNRFIEADLLPFLLVPALQLFSYERSNFKGNDVDKPRNLAKSVTVE